MPNRLELKFPQDFLWGASTSAHQVEGGLHNQWTVWELENAKALAAQAPYHYGDLPSWPAIKKEAQTPANYVSGRTVQHNKYYEQDLDIVAGLHMNAYRLSIEWSSVQPERDAWDAEEIAHYRSVLQAARARGIEPVVTLFHFTMPVWFAKMGGFEKRSNVRYFIDFAEKMMNELGDLVNYVITINEPEVYAHESYLAGHWPPQVQSRRRMYQVLGNLIFAHNQVARRLHRQSDHFLLSIAKNSAYIYPGDDAHLSRYAAGVMQYVQDDYVLKRVARHCDFIGINYYFSDRVYGYRVHNANHKMSDLGWDLQPSDLQQVLERVYEKYKKPILITENGLADASDSQRQWWLMQTIIAMQRAMQNGVKLIGYLHWSLLDNFEWDKGFWPKFGLVSVDRRTMKRTVRPSAQWFGGVIRKLRR